MADASLSYRADQSYYIPLTITKIEQKHALSGSAFQSRLGQYFYPRSHSPGNMSVQGRVADERELQSLGYFIRLHQRNLINTPFDMRFTRIDNSNAGYARLMRFSLQSEGISIRGWIDNFSIVKKGFSNVAPKYNFDFFVVFDDTATSVGISNRVRKYYDLGLGQTLAKTPVNKTAAPTDRDDQSFSGTPSTGAPTNRDSQAWDMMD